MLVAASAAHADSAANPSASAPSSFEANHFEVQLGVSSFFSVQRTTERRPALDDVGGPLRLGWMLTSPASEGFWRGNFEILAAGQGSAVMRGPRHWIAGGSLIVRRNFVQPGARWIPYAQLEGGLVANDVHDDQEQRVIGQSLEFQLGGGFGLRRLLAGGWAAYIEADYRHISNAGMAKRNLGLNSVGPLVGIARLF